MGAYTGLRVNPVGFSLRGWYIRVVAKHAVLGLLAALAILILARPARAQGKPDCTVVLRALNEGRDRGGPRVRDAARMAQRLNTDPDWVERCAESYGRRVRRSDRDNDPELALKPRRAPEDFEEIGREEEETLGDRYVTVIENDQTDRARLKHNRNDDSSNEWEPFETHEWEPHLGREWEPVLHDGENRTEF